MQNSTKTSFIPARESKWFIAIFDLYVRNLFRRRFKNILIDQHYQPSEEDKTIYYLNHTSWWDGLIPLFLNRKFFNQNARAMMEDKQMLDHPFFSKIGAFSVNLNNPRSTVQSLRYAVESMNRPGSSLFIYPEGKIVPFTAEKPDFKQGLGWISNRCPDVDVVPIAVYIHTVHSDKPELFLRIGHPVSLDHTLDTATVTEILETELQSLLKKVQYDSHWDRIKFTRC